MQNLEVMPQFRAWLKFSDVTSVWKKCKMLGCVQDVVSFAVMPALGDG